MFESGGANFFWSRDMTNIDFSIANKIELGEATAEPEKIFQFSGQKVIVFRLKSHSTGAIS